MHTDEWQRQKRFPVSRRLISVAAGMLLCFTLAVALILVHVLGGKGRNYTQGEISTALLALSDLPEGWTRYGVDKYTFFRDLDVDDALLRDGIAFERLHNSSCRLDQILWLWPSSRVKEEFPRMSSTQRTEIEGHPELTMSGKEVSFPSYGERSSASLWYQGEEQGLAHISIVIQRGDFITRLLYYNDFSSGVTQSDFAFLELVASHADEKLKLLIEN